MADLPNATLPKTIISGRFGLPNPSGLLCGLLIGLMLGACSIPLPAPRQANSAAIGISIREWWSPNQWLEDIPEMGYFIRLNEAGDVTAPIEIIRSNYFRENRLYLLNAKPGRYALVATSEFARLRFQMPWPAPQKPWPVRRNQQRPAGGFLARGQPRTYGASQGVSVVFSGSGGGFRTWWNWFAGMGLQETSRALFSRQALYSRRAQFSQQGWRLLPAMHRRESEDVDYFIYTTYFSRPMILKTVVEVLPGRFSVMGAFQVRRHRGMNKADPAQKYYFGAIQTDLVDPRGMPIFNAGYDFSIPSRGEMKEALGDAAAEKLFLRQALEDFRGTPWETLVRRTLARGGGG